MNRMMLGTTLLSICALTAGVYYLSYAAQYDQMPHVGAPVHVDYHAEDMGMPSEAISTYEYFGSTDESQHPNYDVTFDGEILLIEDQ